MTLFNHPTVRTDWKMCPAYGTTETLTINTAVEANTPEDEYRGSHGKPLPGNILKIFDPDTGEIVPRGQRGEVGIKGPTLMMGYIGKPIEETFDDEGFFCTGDGGYVDDQGRLFWEGRLTEIIKTGGANVSPIEIDAVIATFPGVKITQTVGVPHETLGEMVVSCIVAQEGSTLDAARVDALPEGAPGELQGAARNPLLPRGRAGRDRQRQGQVQDIAGYRRRAPGSTVDRLIAARSGPSLLPHPVIV